MPPAIFYDPTQLILRSWWAPDQPGAFDDQRNVARFAVRGSAEVAATRPEFLALVAHWDFRSATTRLDEAKRIDRYGHDPLPVIGGGDLNATASGPFPAQPDWSAVEPRLRAHKGVRHPDGTWTVDTEAVDHLIGRWMSCGSGPDGNRFGGIGFHAVAELALRAGQPPEQAFAPTVNPGGSSLLIDWLLVNDAMRPHVIPGSYRVHVPDRAPYPSDHRLVTAVIAL
ncbi:hypothetical protein [Dactylosporangium sp. CA-092794]|uniref:hypothetical protein n=1 Tax=Dactylosporangium sp. CA-092794 TaxID=3239929 RepID=UPI003D8EDD7E